MGFYNVLNAPGTGDEACACDSWLEHWEKFSRTKARWCSVEGCTNIATVGAHVTVDGYRGTYIIPLCDECNHDDGILSVPETVAFIKADPAETCKPPQKKRF